MGKFHPKIGIDLIGGDYLPEMLFEDLLLIEDLFDPLPHLVFFVPESILTHFESILKKSPSKYEISLVKTKEAISMEDNPLSSLRLKKDSPSLSALTLLKEKTLDAVVSIGNTGALIGGSILTLKMIKGIKRPGLLALLPTLLKPLVVIDVGANVTCNAQHLMQFAKIGIAYQKCSGIPHPKVALLNIGAEKEKGRTEMREAYKKLQLLNENAETPLFIGNIEGKEVFKGKTDVLVTDGFSGNIFLKTAEGMTSFILEKLIEDNLEQPEKKEYHKLMHLLNYAEYPGALICGIEGIVIKCHGYSNAKAIHSGIQGAIRLVTTKFLEKLKKQLKP
jgi:glycerol-3-phosphate acyltransferase PlsX